MCFNTKTLKIEPCAQRMFFFESTLSKSARCGGKVRDAKQSVKYEKNAKLYKHSKHPGIKIKNRCNRDKISHTWSLKEVETVVMLLEMKFQS